jgi:hypothetical protein
MCTTQGTRMQRLAFITLMPLLLVGCGDGAGDGNDLPATAGEAPETPVMQVVAPPPAAPVTTTPAPQPAPLAVIDGEPITVDAFRAAMARRAGYAQDPDIRARLKRFMVHKFRQDELEPRLARLTVTEAELEAYYGDHQADFVIPKKVRATIIRISLPALASADKRVQLARPGL